MTLQISLPDDLADIIDAQLSSGRFASAGDVVAEALRLLDRLDQGEASKLAELRQLWREGCESGDTGEVDFAALKQKARQRTPTPEA